MTEMMKLADKDLISNIVSRINMFKIYQSYKEKHEQKREETGSF